MTIGDDMDLLLDESGFATAAAHAGGTVYGILQKPAAVALEVLAPATRFLVGGAAADPISVGDELELARPDDPDGLSDLYVVESKQPELDRRAVALVLRWKGFVRTFTASEIGLEQIYIDEEYPLFPVAQEDPPFVHDPEIRLRLDPGRNRRALLQWGQLVQPFGPLAPDIRIVDATLYADSAGPVEVPFEVAWVLQPLILGAANWQVFRKSGPWSVPGCSDPGIDHEVPALYAAPSVPDEQFVLASGPAFTAGVEAAKATSGQLVVRATGGGDEIVWLQHSGILRLVLRRST